MLRRLSRKLHLYLGLSAGMILAFVALTGSILVFHEEIDAAMNPELHAVEVGPRRVSVDETAALVEAAFPDEPIARLDLPELRAAPVEFSLRGTDRSVYVDPYSGSILGAHLPGQTVASAIFEFHVTLLAGPTGKQVVGWVGVLFVLIGLTGVILWWRGWRRFFRGFRVRWRASSYRLNFDLHNALGALSVLPLLVLCFTGAGLIFYGAFDRAAHRLTGTPLPPPVQRAADTARGHPPTLEEMLHRAAEALPAARPARIDFPAAQGDPWRVRLRMPGEAHPIGLSMVFFDPESGTILRAENALEVPRARRIGYWYYPLHIGSFGGWGVRVAYALLGLVPVGLGVTGIVIWWKKVR